MTSDCSCNDCQIDLAQACGIDDEVDLDDLLVRDCEVE